MKTMVYNGIVLELPEEKVQFTHSLLMDAIKQQTSSKHIDWTKKLGDVLWGNIKERYPDDFHEASKLFSLLNMNYQICNGGIYQYFDNRYHEERKPCSEHDIARVDMDKQRAAFQELVTFARELFPERMEENNKLDTACKRFQKVWFEEDIELYETIYSEEEELIYDEETEEWIDNPAYEESYELCIGLGCEVREGWHFDDDYYEASDYLEELDVRNIPDKELCLQLFADFAEIGYWPTVFYKDYHIQLQDSADLRLEMVTWGFPLKEDKKTIDEKMESAKTRTVSGKAEPEKTIPAEER